MGKGDWISIVPRSCSSRLWRTISCLPTLSHKIQAFLAVQWQTDSCSEPIHQGLLTIPAICTIKARKRPQYPTTSMMYEDITLSITVFELRS